MTDETYKGILVLSIIALIVLFIGLNSQAQEDSTEIETSKTIRIIDTGKVEVETDYFKWIKMDVLLFNYQSEEDKFFYEVDNESMSSNDFANVYNFLTLLFEQPTIHCDNYMVWENSLLNAWFGMKVTLLIKKVGFRFEINNFVRWSGTSQGNKKVDNDWNWNPRDDNWNEGNVRYNIYHTLTFNGIKLNIKHRIDQCNENCTLYNKK